MNMLLIGLTTDYVSTFKQDMKAAFRYGAFKEMGMDEDVLTDEAIDESLNDKGSSAYIALLDGKMVGGAIVVIDPDASRGRLDFLYVKVGFQGKHIGQFIWSEIEKKHSEAKLWTTSTPYFDRRNIHFYINRCGFHAVEFYNKYHPDPHFPTEEEDHEEFDGMFRFEKQMK